MTRDIYLNNNYAPLFLDNELVWVENKIKLQALRNNVRNQVNAFFWQAMREGRRITQQDQVIFVSFVSTQAQLLGISLSKDQINSFSWGVVGDKVKINLDI